MARLESIALGGFFKTPTHLLPHIGYVLRTPTPDKYYQSEIPLMDPCAGEGEAIIGIADTLDCKNTIYACEMEAQRFATLKSALEKGRGWKEANQVLHGDAFRIDHVGHVGCLYLNPPYDLDPVHGRLEHRFLDRFASFLGTNGVLVFVVPHYALKASADLLSREFEDLTCLRFPDEDFEAYKQVALFARKTDTHESDPEIMGQVLAWASDVSDCAVLGTTEDNYPLRSAYLSSWAMRPFDLKGLLASSKPWRMSTRFGATAPVPHVMPESNVEDLMFREYPIATNPRPAHIAAGIASGLFNGRKVVSENPKLPDLLVKGVFDREYHTVEEKVNKEGEVTGVVQVQQPKLVTTVLDLRAKKYTTLKTSGKTTSLKIEDMSIEDLLDHYGPSLMTVMSEQCPVTYDPKRDAEAVPLAPINRKLFVAQEHATKALVKLLGPGKVIKRKGKIVRQPGKAAILLGEIGSGKTSCALTVGKTIGKRMLVMCPPHLLQSWTNETAAVLPDAEVRILESVSDIDALKDIPSDKYLVAILSRETAKLGHGWESVTGTCPNCGGSLPDEDTAKKRSRCKHKAIQITGPFAKVALTLSLKLGMVNPHAVAVRPFLRSRVYRDVIRKRMDATDLQEWQGFDEEWTIAAIHKVLNHYLNNQSDEDRLATLLSQLLLANYSEARIEAVLRVLKAEVEKDKYNYRLPSVIRHLLLLLTPNSETQKKLLSEGFYQAGHSYYAQTFSSYLELCQKGTYHSNCGIIKWLDGQLTLDDSAPGSVSLAENILRFFYSLTSHTESEEACGEPLFQGVASPRRYPLAKYITKNAKDTFDFLVLDEGHEYATDGSAQERAAHRLTALGIPTLLMTGSIMNGYAASLFANMWAISPDFRAEFSRDDRQRYIDRYGYRKRLLSEKDRETKEVIAFGSHSDRVETSERIIGEAPGILPLFLFRHLLKYSVTLHKTDLAIDLPPCRQIKHLVHASPELMKGYESLKSALVQQIKKDRFVAEKAGKLFGALSELPSYLDRASSDTGNQEDGTYQIRYPESLDRELVASGDTFSADTLSAKEEWLLETVKAELAEGRNVMVFSWHVSLLPRLARIIAEATGEEVPILYADKVATGKRQAWIDAKIVKKNRRVMVANPVCIQTGLNNLVHFSSEIWMENPACNSYVFRQAVGRVDRIGAKKETRIHIPVFANTLQEQLYDLLMRKVAVAVSTDGLDPEASMAMAGIVEDGYLTGLSIGKQLWAMLN